MSLSVNKVSATSDVQQSEKEQAKSIHFMANSAKLSDNNPEKDTFESNNKKKKTGKIVGWALALAAAVIAVVLFKKGKGLENTGKKFGEEIADVADDAEHRLIATVNGGVEDLSGKGGKVKVDAPEPPKPPVRPEKVDTVPPNKAVAAEPSVAPQPSVTPQPSVAPQPSVVPQPSVPPVKEQQALPPPKENASPAAPKDRTPKSQAAGAEKSEPVVTKEEKSTELTAGAEKSVTDTPEAEKSIAGAPAEEKPVTKAAETAEQIQAEVPKTPEQLKAIINERLDSTLPDIPTELKTIKAPELRKYIEELGIKLEEIEKIPQDAYKNNGLVYEEMLPNGEKLIVKRFSWDPDRIGQIEIFNSEGLKLRYVDFGKSEIVVGDMVKHSNYHYDPDGTFMSALIKRDPLGSCKYDANGKLIRVLEDENPRTFIQRRIFFDPLTGEIENIEYYDTTRMGWRLLKKDYFEKGKFLREDFTDFALRNASKKEEIIEKIKFDRVIPEIPKELKTIKIEYPDIKKYIEELGINLEEIKKIPPDEYQTYKTHEARCVIDLPNGKKLIISRYKKDINNINEIRRMFIEGPHSTEIEIILDKEQKPFIVHDYFKRTVYSYIDGNVCRCDIGHPILGCLSYNAEGKLEEVFRINPKTSISRTICLNRQTGEIEQIRYEDKILRYLASEHFNEKGEKIFELFPESIYE